MNPRAWLKTQLLVWTPLLSAIVYASGEETWRPFDAPGDAAPVNLSRWLDPPAGKHGFLGVKGEQFVFENGVEIRFWGVTFTGSGCFPPQSQAPAIADRLARLGVNLARFQSLDAEWARPPLIGWDRQGRLALNPEALDRLDFFMHQLANRGIYSWINGLDERVLPEWLIGAAARQLQPGMKGYIHFTPELRVAHAEFLEQFWSHRSPYTGLEFRDSPYIALGEIAQSNAAQDALPRIPAYWSDLEAEWRRRALHEREQSDDEDADDAHEAYEPDPLDPLNPSLAQRRFFAEVTALSMSDWHYFLRSLSVKVPLAGTARHDHALDLTHQAGMDFSTAEALWNPAPQPEGPYPNRFMVDAAPTAEAHLLNRLAFARLAGIPFVVGEWGAPWPNRSRAELPLWVAANALAQDWNGAIAATYRDSHDENMRLSPYETFNDPCVIGLAPAAALLFHRQEIPRHTRRVIMGLTEAEMESDEEITPERVHPTRLMDVARVETRLRARSASGVFSPTQPENLEEEIARMRGAQRFRRDPERGLALIDTPMTQAAIGRLDALRMDDLRDVEFESDSIFGAVALSSLDDLPLVRSQDILLTLVSDARNRGAQIREEDDGLIVERFGDAPIEILDTPTWTRLRTRNAAWRIEAVDGAGQILRTLPYQFENGALFFKAGEHGTIYYRLRARG